MKKRKDDKMVPIRLGQKELAVIQKMSALSGEPIDTVMRVLIARGTILVRLEQLAAEDRKKRRRRK